MPKSISQTTTNGVHSTTNGVHSTINGIHSKVESASTTATSLPSYKNLPPVPGMPHGCTWGLWDSGGVRDELGTLNLLTPEVIMEARREIQLGINIALNWSLDNCSSPHSRRKSPEHRIFPLPDWTGHDDEISVNTQSGSQWDGFRHWAHQPTKLYYNGVTHAEITDCSTVTRNGIDQWTERGGIVGRGVLLDYSSWANAQGIKYSPVEQHKIDIWELEAVAKAQGTELRPGDILLVRSGFVKWYREASEEERLSGTVNGSTWAGVNGSEESVAWLWDHHFAAVGGDANVFEAWPAENETYRLHDNLLALFGMPIGEMFDLDKLAQTCMLYNRWSFFFTSSPLNFPGGVASPPNAICIL